MTHLSVWLLLLSSLSACASFQPVPYALQPGRIRDPRGELITFIQSNTHVGCISEPEFREQVLYVKVLCSHAVGHQVARLDHVDRVTLDRYDEWYRVVLHHSNGADDFRWTSKSREDTERAADAFQALVKPGAGRAQPPKNAI